MTGVLYFLGRMAAIAAAQQGQIAPGQGMEWVNPGMAGMVRGRFFFFFSFFCFFNSSALRSALLRGRKVPHELGKKGGGGGVKSGG